MGKGMFTTSPCVIALTSVCILVLVQVTGADDECTVPQLIQLKYQLGEFFANADRGILGINIFKK